MEPRRLTFTSPERCVPGATGAGASREFFVQVRDGSVIATVGLGRSHLALVADHAVAVLDEVSRLGGVDTFASDATVDIRPLDVPLFPLFVADAVRTRWDAAAGLLTVELSLQETGDTLEIALTPLWARRFSHRARAVLRDSPVCPFCAQPVAAAGHVCPRLDGLTALR